MVTYIKFLHSNPGNGCLIPCVLRLVAQNCYQNFCYLENVNSDKQCLAPDYTGASIMWPIRTTETKP